MGEMAGLYTDSQEWRLKSSWEGSLKINRKNGYLESRKDARLTIALFKDTVNHRDIIGFVKNGCSPPIQDKCENGFLEFDVETQTWNNADVFPWDEVYAQCEEFYEKEKCKKEKQLQRPFTDEELEEFNIFSSSVIVLPEYGTTIKIVNDCTDTTILTIKWNGKAFEIQ